jgi:hypothetical protein
MQQQLAGAFLSCRQFREGHTDYLDGHLPDAVARQFDTHVQSCSGCQRFDHVLRRGLLLARNLPEIQPSAHFHENLQSRLLQLDTESARRPIVANPGTLIMIAAVLAVVALVPMFRLLEQEASTPAPAGVPVSTVPFTVTPLALPGTAVLPPGPATAALLVNEFETATFSPVVVSPPAVQTNPNTPRLISYPLQTLTR